jgi:ABC-type dipeptide/oligopeptide/nickel transport system permease component
MTGTDLWTRRARPSFLYVICLVILYALPLGIIAAFRPSVAAAMIGAMSTYLRAIPDSLWTLFGTGYLGYTAARQWGKVKGVE